MMAGTLLRTPCLPLGRPLRTPNCDGGGLDPTFGPPPVLVATNPIWRGPVSFYLHFAKIFAPFQFHRSGWPSDAPRTLCPLKVDQAVVKQIRCTLCHHKSVLNQIVNQISASTDVVIKFCPIQIPLARWEQ